MTSTKEVQLASWVKKAKTLLEALPYLQRFNGKRIVIKYGGSAMVNAAIKESFARDIVMMHCVGVKPVIVHGGGPMIGEVLKQMGIVSRFHRGLRITDAPTMDVVEMVLGGKVNQDIVGLIEQHGGRAIGLAGKDGHLIEAKRVAPSPHESEPEEWVDLGHVGEVVRIDPKVIFTIEAGGFIPIIAPIGVNEAGESLNINADLVASAVATALGAEKLVLLTDVEGVLDAGKTLISSLSLADIESLIKTGVIAGGMIPKLQCCAEAVKNGVSRAHIIDGRVEHAILLEMFTDRGVGTLIRE